MTWPPAFIPVHYFSVINKSIFCPVVVGQLTGFLTFRKDEILKTVGIVWECCESFASLPKGTMITNINKLFLDGNTLDGN